MKTAVIYARVSSTGDRQTTERQVADLKRYIGLNEMELVKVYEEKMSGAKENRPVLMECVEFCISNRIHTLCVSEISRLGRSTKIVVNTLDELTKAGVNVYIQNLPLCTLNESGEPNPIAKMITAVLSSFAEIDDMEIPSNRRSVVLEYINNYSCKGIEDDGNFNAYVFIYTDDETGGKTLFTPIAAPPCGKQWAVTNSLHSHSPRCGL